MGLLTLILVPLRTTQIFNACTFPFEQTWRAYEQSTNRTESSKLLLDFWRAERDCSTMPIVMTAFAFLSGMTLFKLSQMDRHPPADQRTLMRQARSWLPGKVEQLSRSNAPWLLRLLGRNHETLEKSKTD